MSHDLRISARTEKQNKFKIEGGSKLEVFDEEGEKIYEGEFKSFTSNFLKLLYGSMVGSGTAKAKDLTTTNVEMNSFPQSTFNVAGGTGVKKFGLVVGTNSTTVSVSDYNITVPVSLTVNDTVVSASSVGANSISVEISRQIGNNSGSTVNLKEAGLICGSEDEVNSNVLIARDLLDITLENGKKSVWRYTINFNFANDRGGFIQLFADKMFGLTFTETISNANWSKRCEFGCVVFNGKMWVIGGRGNDTPSALHNVWYSSDGITWTLATSSAGWSQRYAFQCCVYDGKMWVMGGRGSDYQAKNDVWYSSDGITWTLATSSAGWSARFNAGCVVYDGKMWVMGGHIGTYSSTSNDVWYSSDGITWTLATSSAGWSARAAFGCLVYDGKMWVIQSDAWYSTDGVNWTLSASSGVGAGYTNVIYNNTIMIVAGGSLRCSSDGITWQTLCRSVGWSNRSSFNCLVFNDKLWVMGGVVSGTVANDVWNVSVLSEVNLLVGSSDSTFSPTGTALGALIADGSGSGQLVYGVMPGAGTTEPTVSGNKTKFSLAREFTNNSGADITVREVGLFSGTDMLARLILAQPVTIANGGSEIITVDFETEV